MSAPTFIKSAEIYRSLRKKGITIRKQLIAWSQYFVWSMKYGYFIKTVISCSLQNTFLYALSWVLSYHLCQRCNRSHSETCCGFWRLVFFIIFSERNIVNRQERISWSEQSSMENRVFLYTLSLSKCFTRLKTLCNVNRNSVKIVRFPEKSDYACWQYLIVMANNDIILSWTKNTEKPYRPFLQRQLRPISDSLTLNHFWFIWAVILRRQPAHVCPSRF